MRWTRRPEGSNWGDFGPDDQIGKLNLITPERRLAGVREVQDGISFMLGLPLDYPGGSVLAVNRRPPQLLAGLRADSSPNYNFQMSEVKPHFTDIISDDAVLLYTQYSSQWDALSHIGALFDADGDGVAEPVYYNGYRAGEHIRVPGEDSPGAAALGIERMAETCAQGRAVLIDFVALHGTDRVVIGYDEMMAALDATHAEIQPGDFLCLYTGFADAILAMDHKPDVAVLNRTGAALDGRDERLLQWITDSGVVALCADNFAVEHYPTRPAACDHFAALPLHEHCLFKQGIYLGELWYFRELAEWLRPRRRSAFLLTAPPLRLTGSVGSPATPVATV